MCVELGEIEMVFVFYFEIVCVVVVLCGKGGDIWFVVYVVLVLCGEMLVLEICGYLCDWLLDVMIFVMIFEMMDLLFIFIGKVNCGVFFDFFVNCIVGWVVDLML